LAVCTSITQTAPLELQFRQFYDNFFTPSIPSATPAEALALGHKNFAVFYQQLIVHYPNRRATVSCESSKRVQTGAPMLNFSTSRYLIDFITSISDASSGLASLDCDPGVDSNPLSDQYPPNESAVAYQVCQLPDGAREQLRLSRARSPKCDYALM
jgi:DNA-dependent RNA polymerase auxiliary subunit epsilon